MNKINLSIRRMLLVASILFSFYTMLIPWVQINPVLSDLTAMIEETNNNVLDSVSSAIGTIMSFFDSEDSSQNRVLSTGDTIIKAFADEKEIVHIISKGKCTPYDCSRVFLIAGNHTEDETQTIYLAAGYLFYVVWGLGIIALLFAIVGKYGFSFFYVGAAGLNLCMIISSVTNVNEVLEVSAFSIMDSIKTAEAGFIAVAIFTMAALCDVPEKVTEKQVLNDTGSSYTEKSSSTSKKEKLSYESSETNTSSKMPYPGKSDFGNAYIREEHSPRELSQRQKLAVGILLSICVLAVFIIGIVSLIKSAAPVSVDLSSYISLEITGFDEYGKANFSFSEESFKTDIENLLAEKNNGNEKEAITTDEAEQIADEVLDTIDINLSEETGLSNGDEVELTASVDSQAEELLAKYNVRTEFKDAVITREVTGLPDVTDYDPFEDTSVTFNGAEPYGEASVSYYGDYSDVIEINAYPNDGLRNGDSVELSVYSDVDEETLLEDYGLRISKSQKTFKVSGLMYYPDRLEEFQSEELDKVIQNALKIATENVISEYDNDEQLTGIVSRNQYFASSFTENSQFHNQLFCVYEIHYADNTGSSGIYYYYVKLTNVMIDPKTEEVHVDYNTVSVPQKPSLSTGSFNLSEFVMVQIFPPRLLSGFTDENSIYDNYVMPLEETCWISSL